MKWKTTMLMLLKHSSNKIKCHSEKNLFGMKLLSHCLSQWANYLFKVSQITLEQRSIERCSNVILLTLNRYLPPGFCHDKQN